MSPRVKKWLRPLAMAILGRHYPTVLRHARLRKFDFRKLEAHDASLAALDDPNLAAMIGVPDPAYLDALRPRHARGVRRRNNGTETLLYSDDSRIGFVIDTLGDRIWRGCDGTRTIAEINRQLSGPAEAPPAAEMGLILRQTLLRLFQLNLIDFPEGSPYGSFETMPIDLRQVTFYVINCTGATARRAFMEEQLGRLGLKFELVTAVESEPPWIGLALSNLKVLRNPNIRIPFAILEDDCAFVDDFSRVFNVPKSTDALYLGVSKFGIEQPGELSWGRWNNAKFARFSDDYLRPLNMLSAHAILYLSERFRRNVIEALDTNLGREDFVYTNDIPLAVLQARHLVLTPNDPVCYQSAEHDGEYDATRSPLRDLIG